LHAIQQDNQLEAAYLVLLDQLSNARHADLALEDVINDVPLLDEEQGEEEQNMDEEMYVEEEREEEERQEDLNEPYQLTRYYRDQLVQFQDDYV